jgi:hypothetical protein
MHEQVCFCGHRLNQIEQILYYAGDAICCNLQSRTPRSTRGQAPGREAKGPTTKAVPSGTAFCLSAANVVHGNVSIRRRFAVNPLPGITG